MRVGAASVLIEQPTPETLLRTIQNHRATLCFSVPRLYRSMLDRIEGFDLSSLRACVSAAEALPRPVFDLWRAATGLPILDSLGSTEMLHTFIAATPDALRPGATGKPLPGYRAIVVDDDFRPLPPGEVGRLAIRGPVGCRYLEDPHQTDYVQHGWNLTGDAFLVDEDDYFWHQCRTEDMIVSARYNISGLEVAEVLLEHPLVSECAVVASPDPERTCPNCRGQKPAKSCATSCGIWNCSAPGSVERFICADCSLPKKSAELQVAAFQQPRQAVTAQPIIFDAALVCHRIDLTQRIVGNSGVNHDQSLGLHVLRKPVHQDAKGHTAGKIINAAETGIAGNVMTSRQPPQSFAQLRNQQGLGHGHAAPHHRGGGFMAEPDIDRRRFEARGQHPHYGRAHRRQLMDMLVPIDEGGRLAECSFERVDLPVQFGIDLRPVEMPGQRPAHQGAQRRQPAFRRRVRHGAERRVVGQGEMQPDIGLVGIGAQPCRMIHPKRRQGHAAGGGQASAVDKVADRRTDTGR
jgi:hypothetical protein